MAQEESDPAAAPTAGTVAEAPALAGPGGGESPSGGPARAEGAEAEAPAQVLAASVPEADGSAPGGGTAAVSVGRPGRPLLAGAAVLGALLITVPVLLTSRDRAPEGHDRVVADQAGTVLGGDATQDPGAGYASSAPSTPAASAPSVKPKPATHRPSPAKTVAAHPAAKPTTAATKKPAAPAKTKTKKPTTTGKSGTKSTAESTLPSDVLVTATRVLRAGQSIEAKKARLRMQTDGNLVVYDEHNKARWATMTFGSNYQAVFQADGNLVVYTSDSRPVWASQTPGHNGAILRVQGDGNVVIYAGSTPVWATNTQH
ncbi:hypothetical protein ACIRBZ_16785 [Streptomyces sp. NPDC094038]|uniref:hypothetical protein n=1 Tax=Streptomyces sp. NPDC094038 TaxID=3366055 RepID=UPI003826B49F